MSQLIEPEVVSSHSPTERQIVLSAMRERPHDPWPRGEGHVVLGTPGGPRLQKAYHEPGGSFSPSAGSFGISILLTDRSECPRTSDEVPLEHIAQHLDWSDANRVPGLRTETPFYQCVWRMLDEDRWEGVIDPHGEAVGILIRSVGAAGGPIERLEWEASRLIVNRRWVVTFDAAPTRVDLGTEDESDWLTANRSRTLVEDASGWAYARVILPAGKVRILVRDTAACAASPLAFDGVKSRLQLDLPDERFSDSLNAQASHLLMGFVGRQTCPGEPTNYPLAWERDGAYSVIAMARCGQIETAKQLAVYFAENDFFGGFGAEGDAPGSTIGVLANVALISNDRAFQQWSWEHVKRKLAMIHRMATTPTPITQPWVGPIVPEHLDKECLPFICQPARDDLVIGSMDLHYPALYTTAMSFRGLRQAMKLAEVLGKTDEIDGAAELAQRLQRGWHACLDFEKYANERTYMAGQWPTWVAGADTDRYRAALQRRWESEHGEGSYPTRPLWTYFTCAEAHQWLLLGEPAKVWHTLRYFWENQCSPGLYTYWEGEREENSFGLWQHLRGWVKPQFVTPHYWTAAEMLLLQLDMLAYVDESRPRAELVVGAGVPTEWIGRPFSVKGLPTTLGTVDWAYDGAGRLAVHVHRDQIVPVRAGPAFGAGVRIHLTTSHT